MTVRVLNWVSTYGLALVIAVGVIIVLWKVGKLLPKYLEDKLEMSKRHAKEQEEKEQARTQKYDQQMEILVTIAQQSIEAQKRGNEVIAQNTETIKSFVEIQRDLATTVTQLKASIDYYHPHN